MILMLVSENPVKAQSDNAMRAGGGFALISARRKNQRQAMPMLPQQNTMYLLPIEQ